MLRKAYRQCPDVLLSILEEELGLIPTYRYLEKSYVSSRVIVKKLTLTQIFHFFSLVLKSKKRDTKMVYSGRDTRHLSLRIRRETARRFYWEILIYAQKHKKYWHLCFNLNVEL